MRYGVVIIILCLCVTAYGFSIYNSADRPSSYSQTNAADKVKLAYLTGLLVLSISIGPYFNQVDIRTNPVPGMGPKYTLLCLASLALIRYQNKPLAATG